MSDTSTRINTIATVTINNTTTWDGTAKTIIMDRSGEMRFLDKDGNTIRSRQHTLKLLFDSFMTSQDPTNAYLTDPSVSNP
jgi:hypothetical protein